MASEEGEEGEVLHSLFARKVVRIIDSLVVKYGPNLRPSEGETLRFIADNTTIPVPKLHEVRRNGDKVTAIVMDYKDFVAEQLRSYVLQLRELKGDGKYIGSLGGGKAIIGYIARLEGGPFESEEEFNQFVLSDLLRGIPDLMRHYAKYALTTGHEIVFTHADLAPRNIMVDDTGRVTGIIDWEESGWYPEYWEHNKAMRDFKPMPNWPEYLARIVPPQYEKEYIGFSWLSRLLRS
ncbi:kinase-like protein [Aspergillus karnatakaensis]|uniref:aminoglycoside phosphotransferase family protein n=1 Tax=Aspergillus karnatakaensis TaxID=1810916 RepID=UPI003CCE4E00